MPRALIVVDVQKDFAEGGSLACEGGTVLATKISDYILQSGDAYDAVVASKDWHPVLMEDDHFKQFPIHCVADSPGSEFVEGLNTEAIDEIFYKGQEQAGFSAFQGTNDIDDNLDDYLRGRLQIDTVDIVGIATDYCVAATAREANELGYHVNVILDLCVPVDQKGSLEVVDHLISNGIGISSLEQMQGVTLPVQDED